MAWETALHMAAGLEGSGGSEGCMAGGCLIAHVLGETAHLRCAKPSDIRAAVQVAQCGPLAPTCGVVAKDTDRLGA